MRIYQRKYKYKNRRAFGDSLVNLVSIETITQEPHDFNRVECQI
nr:MAG TPA: hypothetical protein [Bacteriophage sp.]